LIVQKGALMVPDLGGGPDLFLPGFLP